jgi:SNF2 family DNA or RNA helicase
VFFLWKHQKAELERIFKARKISYEVLDGDVKGDAHRAKIVDDYQTGKYKTLLMHPKTGAYGLTLTKATSVIYASPIYEASAKLQGDARVLRGMQDQITESIVVLAKDTRDEHAYRVFSGKMDRLVALNNLFAR